MGRALPNSIRPMDQRVPEHIKNLNGEEAIRKLKDVVDHEHIAMFHTGAHSPDEHVRPMTVQKVCDQGNLWMLSARSSQKNKDITVNPQVMVTIAVPGRSQFLAVHGNATVVDDQRKKNELWSNLAKAWFPEGKDDPELTVLKVAPSDCYYWDTKDGRVVSLLKIATAAVTGNMNDSGGVEGSLRV